MALRILNNADTVKIEMFGPVGDDFWSEGWTLERFRKELKGISAAKVLIEMKSFGGDLFEAYAIHDEIRSLSARVTAEIVGTCASAITIIAAAADDVAIRKNNRYLVHQAGIDPAGLVGGRITKETAANMAKDLESYDKQIIRTYIKRTGKSADALMELMKQEKWMTADEALEWGFVDRVISDNPIILNTMSDKTQTPSNVSQEDYDKMKEENKTLKENLEALKTELEALKAESEKKDEEDVEAQIDAGIETGKIKADAKESFFDIGKKIGPKALKAMLENIEQPQPQSLASVPQVGSREGTLDVKKMSFDEKYEAFKAGKITLKQMEG